MPSNMLPPPIMYEEISTIFVVGFPDDLQEREFQNMFTFCNGFEGATLKSPAANEVDDSRKQTIGFAKFVSRNYALEAQNILTNRKVDERGFLLKAEMAKKNLHIYRKSNGTTDIIPAPVPSPFRFQQSVPSMPNPISTDVTLSSTGTISSSQRNASLFGSNLHPLHSYAQAFPQSTNAYPETQLPKHVVGSPFNENHFLNSPPPLPRDLLSHNDDFPELEAIASSLSEHKLLSDGEDPSPSRSSTSSSELSTEEKIASSRESSFSRAVKSNSSSSHNNDASSDEDKNIAPSRSLLYESHQSSMPTKIPTTTIGLFDDGYSMPLSRSPSPPKATSSGINFGNSLFSSSSDNLISRFAGNVNGQNGVSSSFSGLKLNTDYGQFERIDRTKTPILSSGGMVTPPITPGSSSGFPSLMNPTASSTASLNQQTNYPPISANASSGYLEQQQVQQQQGRSVDQNPPCNTLYVGNLPSSTNPEELEVLFSRCRGYKRLCFRMRANGPMCFVEFEDVVCATQALHELYGSPLSTHTKGGIRLSYSKNPLGVRLNNQQNYSHGNVSRGYQQPPPQQQVSFNGIFDRAG